MGKDVSKRKSIRSAKITTEICISAVILALSGYGVKKAIDTIEPVGSSPYIYSSANEVVTEPITEPVDPDKIIFESAEIDTKDKFRGDLILVNHDHKYYSGNEELVALNEKLREEDVSSYVGNDNNMQIVNAMYRPLTDMLNDFNKATGYDDIVIIGGYRTTERQQELYDEDLEATGLDASERVALPGHSEHESGYAVDFTTSTTWDYDGTGKYDWINQNCWKYGIILRYDEDKTDITKIQYEPWHYRYVGVPHAYYMFTKGLCFEEYIDLLRDYTYESEHLVFEDENGAEYEIYFVPSDDGAEITYVPVPTSVDYDISGNNVDGFIVTVYKTEGSAPVVEPLEDDEEPAEEATEEDTTEEETSAEEDSTEDTSAEESDEETE